ncbi:flagellar basal-body rod protein FlgF/flagellar basal-body rod protein FlgG [Fluviicoccus keumensis]|uniref:Flagellar basal-body rod protein FlgF/flagellar basal-body rod protein FlgG n=1 Tax=Fluviicoccus keumensis TaxID=1435465 RepID=A0A4Q7YMC3_9GAMM|nr:flagellar hook-basal body complex protein [Fluviicoccus keumensis]RZU38510.1 flagellar basal-body rod protein FlgF/flagellar basal-body rod protein FlgG [Fluviicoccus keumensis]
MSDVIMQLADVMQREVDSVARIAQNAANVATAGYKARIDFSRLLTATGNDASSGAQVIQEWGASDAGYIDLTDGVLKVTGQDTDLAASGKGWFVVSGGGQQWLTRDGRFRIDANGFLQTRDGLAVMGEEGPLRPGTSGFQITTDGRLIVHGQETGRIRMARVEDARQLVGNGNGLYRLPAAPAWMAAEGIHQGMLEGSNVSVSTDMVRLLEKTRHIESVQRALQSYDAILNSGINQIGKE